MAPHSEYLKSSNGKSNNPGLSLDTLNRTISDISFQLSKESIDEIVPTTNKAPLASISELDDAKCECCGLSEEYTGEYIRRVRAKFSGRLICGLCAVAVQEEVEKNGGKREEALGDHMSACIKFNRIGRTHPVLYGAEAMREMLKKSRTKSISPKGKGCCITRSNSCMPAIAKEIADPTTLKFNGPK